MNDPIRREDVIATIGVMYERCDTYDITDYRDLMLEAVKVLPSADRPQEWIPCSEKLPDDNREVLISLEWGIDIGTYERGEWRSEWINHYDDDNVLAWMPLPKPYKADRKTENSSEIPNNCEDLQDWKDRMWAEAVVTEPQTEREGE